MNVKEANELISHLSDVIDSQVNKRGLVESQLFPVTAYICVAFYNTYDCLYNILKKISEKITPEKMGKESKKILSELHALSIFYIPLYYLPGRMGYIHRNGGAPHVESEEQQKQTMFILDFWKRLASSYHPNGALCVEDAGGVNLALNQEDVDWTLEHLREISKEEALKLKKTMANLELFSFLDECEARAKIHDHGPYKINDKEALIFREISHLYAGGKPHFPWSETKLKAPYENIAFAFKVKDLEISIDNLATMTTNPPNFTQNITAAAIFTREKDTVKPLNFDVLDAFNTYATEGNKELFKKFYKWSKKERLLAGAFAYCYGFARYTNFVGITSEIDWNLTEYTMNTYVPIFLETDHDPGIARFFRTKRQKKKEGPSLYLLPEN